MDTLTRSEMPTTRPAGAPEAVPPVAVPGTPPGAAPAAGARPGTAQGAPAGGPTPPGAADKVEKGGIPLRPLLIVGTIVVAAAVFGGRLWWHSVHFAETDNATVSGHVHPVSARISGVVVTLNIEDNQTVKAGTPLLVLDRADADVQIERLKAQLLQADANIAAAGAQIAQARAQTGAAQAQIAQAQANLVRSEQDIARVQRLYSGELRAVSKQEVDAATAARDAALADVATRKASAGATEQTIAAALAAREAAIAQKAALQAQLKDAQLQAGYTSVLAPSDGRIGKRTVELGQRVTAGQQLAAVVQGDVWVTANFKETQLAKMHVGQQATVSLDAFPGREFKARIDSFAPASGATFSLLPPDNATGNFTKIVQRVPVKLVFDKADMAELGDRLVPGLSATVSVDLGT